MFCNARFGVFWYLAAALFAAAGGGFVAVLLGSPLPWMLGAMVAAFVFALVVSPPPVCNKSRPVLPPVLRRLALVVIGVYLGGQFANFGDVQPLLKTLPVSIFAVLVYSAVCTFAVYGFLRRRLKLDAATAYCSSLPGGLSPVIGLAGEHNADTGVVALLQSIRVAMVLFITPFAARALSMGAGADDFVFGLPPAGLISAGGVLPALVIAAAAMLIGAKLGGVGGSMLPALLLSSAASYGGWMTGALPPLPLAAALVMLGTYAGMSLANLRRTAAAKTAVAAFAAGAFMMALAAFCAPPLWHLAGLPPAHSLLALAPGGIGEMALTALEIGAPPHWVLLHHFARISVLLLLSPLILRALKKP
ncbi:MAG: AbrB family transcriptional regulator [Gammaproteobacteria bacterium]